MNILMISWVAGHVAHPQCHALLCSSGSRGYSAFRRSLGPGYPPNTSILLTNIDVRDMNDDHTGIIRSEEDRDVVGFLPPPPPSPPPSTTRLFSIITHIRLYDTSVPPLLELLNVSTPKPLSSSIPHIHMVVISNVTALPPRFLSDCGGLASIDLNGVSCLTTLHYGLLIRCTGLTSIDFTPLSSSSSSLSPCDASTHHHHHHLPSSFLLGCTGLVSVNLRGLSLNDNGAGVTELLFGFLEGCTSLQTIDLTPLSNVRKIGAGFMNGCLGLVSIDLTYLRRITEIPPRFMQGCTGLTSIDFTPLEAITAPLPTGFLKGMTGLTSVNFNGLGRHATSLPNGFLEGCTGVSTIDLTPFAHVTQLPIDFLHNCSGLTSIDLTPFDHKMECIPRGFLSGCVGLESIALMELIPMDPYVDDDEDNEYSIGLSSSSGDDVLPYGFLCGLPRLQSIDLSPLFRPSKNSCTDTTTSNTATTSTSVTSPAAAATSLSEVKRVMSVKRRVVELPWGMLHNCKSLTSIDLSPLRHVEIRGIPNAFLRGCSGLTAIDVSPLLETYCDHCKDADSQPHYAFLTREIPNGFLSGCTGISSIEFTHYHHRYRTNEEYEKCNDERGETHEWCNMGGVGLVSFPADLVARFRGLPNTITHQQGYLEVEYNFTN